MISKIVVSQTSIISSRIARDSVKCQYTSTIVTVLICNGMYAQRQRICCVFPWLLRIINNKRSYWILYTRLHPPILCVIVSTPTSFLWIPIDIFILHNDTPELQLKGRVDEYSSILCVWYHFRAQVHPQSFIHCLNVKSEALQERTRSSPALTVCMVAIGSVGLYSRSIQDREVSTHF